MLGQAIEKARSGRYGWDVQVLVQSHRRVRVDHRSNHGQIAGHANPAIPTLTGGLGVDRSWLPGCVDGLNAR
jgi:hypothetical protein